MAILIKLSKIYKRLNIDLVNLIEQKIREFYNEFGVNPSTILIPESKKELLLKECENMRIGTCALTIEPTEPIYFLGDREPHFQENTYYISEIFGFDIIYTSDERLMLGNCRSLNTYEL